jgi:hypothetical protein
MPHPNEDDGSELMKRAAAGFPSIQGHVLFETGLIEISSVNPCRPPMVTGFGFVVVRLGSEDSQVAIARAVWPTPGAGAFSQPGVCAFASTSCQM